MQLKDALQELLALEGGPGQFLSLYLDTSVNQQGKRTHEIFFNKKASQFEKTLEKTSERRLKILRRNLERVRAYLSRRLKKDTRGVALFVNSERDYFKALQLPVPVPNKLVVSDSPHLNILIELVETNRHYCIVLLDQHAGKIFSVYLNDLLETREISDDTVPGRTKVGGWSQMRYQRHRKDHIEHFMQELGRLLERFVKREKPNRIILCGTQSNIAEFRRHLSGDGARRIVLTKNLPFNIDEPQLISRVRECVEELEAGKDRQVTERLYHRLTNDYRAVVGLEETLFNLQMGRLQGLVISPNLEAPGYQCTKCDFLFSRKGKKCPYCQGALKEVDIRDVMEKIAEHQKIEIEVINQRTFLDSLGGAGGFLKFWRHPPTGKRAYSSQR